MAGAPLARFARVHSVRQGDAAAANLDGEAKYRALIESIDEGFCIIRVVFDQAGMPVDLFFLEVNSAFERQTGLRDVQGKSVRDLLPNLEQHWFEIYGRIARTGEAMRFVKEAMQLNRWYDVYGWRFGGPNDDQVAVLFTDITQRKLDEETLRASEELLNLALLAGETGAWDRDYVRGQIRITDSYRKLVGLAPDQPYDYQTWLELVHPDDLDRCRAYGDAFFASKDATEWNLEFRIVTLNRGIRWHRSVGRMKRAADGTPLRFTGVNSDITERRTAEVSLRESEERFREIANGLPLIVWMHEEHGELEFVNQTFCEFFNVRQEEMRGGKWKLLIHPDDVGPYSQAFADAVQGRTPFHGEARVRNAQGQWRWVESWGRPRVTASGEFRGFVGTSADITRRKHAEQSLQFQQQELEEALRKRTEEIIIAQKSLALSQRMAAVGTLAAGLAHDMNNLLFPLRRRLDLLRQHGALELEVRSELAIISALLDHLRDLSRNLTLFSRDPEKEGIVGCTNLAQWHGSVQKLLDASVGDGILVIWDFPNNLTEAAIAPHRLTQAVQNLMQNACDAVTAARERAEAGQQYQPRIAIAARQEDDAVTLTVSDNGIGMDDNTKQRCIEPFFTTRDRGQLQGADASTGIADPPATRAGTASPNIVAGGSGLGLSLAHQIVERAGGSMQIDSTPGVGTNITLMIPVAK